MYDLNMAHQVLLALRTVVAVRTLECRWLAALPALMVHHRAAAEVRPVAGAPEQRSCRRRRRPIVGGSVAPSASLSNVSERVHMVYRIRNARSNALLALRWR